jgi:succinate dehydrogenase / fumarate reductase flavoprotein subunit
MIVPARATLISALERRETRGAHNREDFPEQDPEQRANVIYDAAGVVSWQALPEAPAEVVALAEGGATLEAAGKLLE